MDPTLTREKAHKYFGDLYRKERPADLQKKVDDVVGNTNDIFLRIQKIEELDAGHEKNEAIQRKNQAKDKNDKLRKDPEQIALQHPRKKKDGVLKKLFGGDVARWGSETNTLESGWFGTNLKPSGSSYKVFSAFKENQIVAIIKGFRLAIAYGWEVWDAPRYNTVMAAYQFFDEYVKMPGILKTADKAENLISATMKFQKLYASLILYRDYEKILSEDFLNFVEKVQAQKTLAAECESFVKFLKKIDIKTPTMQNIIRSYHALASSQVRSWEEVVKDLNPVRPVYDAYRAPESVLEKIRNLIKKTKDDIRNKKSEAEEIEEIRQKYFKFDGSRVLTNFLNPITAQIADRIFQKNLITETFLKNQKGQPHRLLYLILKDLDLVVGSLLTNPIVSRAKGATETVVVFRSTLFRPHLDEIDAIIRELESFSKNNANFTYSFKDFHNNPDNQSDVTLVNLFSLIKRSNKLFTRMVVDIRTVLSNHKLAAEHSNKRTEGPDKQDRTKSLPIENFESASRFIPFHDHTIITNDRFNDKTVIAALEDIAMNLYNYLYIFKDDTTVNTLGSSVRLKSEIQAMEKTLVRLGVTAE